MKKKNILILLPLIALTSCGTQVDLTKNAPDYSNAQGEFLTFAYASPTDGTYTENGVSMSTGVDYRTAERYEEYKEAGLNTMLIQGNDPYSGEDWETSQLKKNMDNCISAGLSRCIVFDSRLQKLSASKTPIVGDGCEFATQEELNSYAADCMKDYSKHAAFYGLMIMDEPTYLELPAFGSVYQAIKSVKDCYIEANLLPYSASDTTRYSATAATMTSEEAYQAYLDSYIANAKPEKILMDSYPIRYDGSTYSIANNHLRGLQILADTAKKHGLVFEAVAQTYGGATNGTSKMGAPTFADMEWQMNAYMGFGVEKYGYFTYWRKQNNATTGEWFTDGTSFMSQYGEKTNLYYSMQTIHQEMQKMAPTLLQFDYQASNTYVFAPVAYSTGYTNTKEESFALLSSSSISGNEGSVALITELKDSEKNQYMYMVMNAMDPDWKADDPDVMLDISLDFGSDYNAVEILYRGNTYYQSLDHGVYHSSIDAGYAEYLMPYKA